MNSKVLNEHLKGVADAIREKKGTTEKINPQDFASEIASIEGGGSIEYLDVSGLQISDIGVLLQMQLLFGAKNTKYIEYDADLDVFRYTIGTGTYLNGIGNISAVAVDLQEILIAHNEDPTQVNDMSFPFRDFIIMSMENYGHDAIEVEALLDSIPRITKEEFYSAPEKPKKPINGAWIQHIDGTLYTGDQWTAGGFNNDMANGVAVINEDKGVSLVVSKDKFDPMPWSSMPDTLIEGILTSPDKVGADNVYCGAEDTATIAAVDPNSAAIACMNYTFPNGQKGYLMSVGEGYTIYITEYKIRPLMQLLGKTWEEDYAWSCVQRDASNAYVVRLAGIEDFDHDAKSSNYIACPVCTLENYTFAE